MNAGEKFASGVRLFNARKFFQAHEAWEELWLAETGPERTFLQGLIQLAAAFHHHSRGNLRGARSLLARGIAKLDRFPAGYHGLDLPRLRLGVGEWLRWLGGREETRPPRLPRIMVSGSLRAVRPRSSRNAAKKRSRR